MAKQKEDQKKTRSVGIRLYEGEHETLRAVVDRVKLRYQKATPDLSDIVLELMGINPEYYVSVEDREFVRSRMKEGHPEGLFSESGEKATP